MKAVSGARRVSWRQFRLAVALVLLPLCILGLFGLAADAVNYTIAAGLIILGVTPWR